MREVMQETLLLVQSFSLFFIAVILCLTVKHMKRVCMEMRKAQEEAFGLIKKNSFDGVSDTLDEGTRIENGIDLRDRP